MSNNPKSDAPNGQRSQRGGQQAKGARKPRPQETSGMSFTGSNLPMLFPGYPERMLQWFERLHTAVALHAKFHKDVVREREYQPRPTVIVTAEELNH